MKTALKRILSFVCILCIAFIGVFVMPTVTANAATAQYVKVTETPDDWSGDYLIVYEAGKVALNGGLSSLDVASNTISVTISNNTIEANNTTNAAKFTIAKSGSNYTVKSASGYYIGLTAARNRLESSNSTKHTNTITLSNGNAMIKSTNQTSYNLQYNADSGQTRFRYYKGTQKNIALYKLVENVSADEPSISMDEVAQNYMQVDETLDLNVTTKNVTETVVWSSSDTSVATVDTNGNVTAKAMGEVTITATAHGKKATQEIKVYPEENSELTIAEAIEVCELTGNSNAPYTYSTTGTIESIDTPYDSGYQNITVTIGDGTDTIKAFRMAGGSELVVGDTITVTGALINYDGNTPEFNKDCTYVRNNDAATDAIREELNNVNAYMQLAYSYNVTKDMQPIYSKDEVTDTLNRSAIGIATYPSYTDWSDKSFGTKAVYTGNSHGGNDSIQLRSNNSNSGIVTTTSGGKAKKVIVTWNTNTSAGRTLDIYGSNTAYSAASDLYADETKGDHLGSIAIGSSTTELEITGDYAFIGLRSKSGAMYLDEIQIVWESEGAGEMKDVEVLSNSEFFIKCAVDASLVNIEGIDGYGIAVSIAGTTVKYTADAQSWKVENGKAYVVINLGDIINDTAKLNATVTVKAFVVVGDDTHYASGEESVKAYSVKEMVGTYYNVFEIAEVEHLYNYLFN